MSARNARLREKLRMRLLPERDACDDEDRIEWREDWANPCEVCGQMPCLAAVLDGVIVLEALRCAECLDAEPVLRLSIGSGY
ncbi:hypothetical protein BDI4_910053 [Burkholderia diffusa]|uniref:hypothetical protein n=1 Tax=Burkholderia diffusa TaxID=488732 RepID=UPI001CAEC124|nr:hypothetical protein [Burkholderia diffusa]CAG9265697.1 hypothetical protein BDI4_910053 [Burkholderia diffusa]